MQSHHWLMLVLVFVIGYVVARYFPQPGQALGLQ